MMEQQKLLQNKQSGPVFESGPGWGAKVKTWFAKYLYKVILPLVIVVLVVYGITSRNSNQSSSLSPLGETNLENTSAISQVVVKGDGRIHVARRAIAQYLASNPDISLTAGQKVYLETVLGRKINSAMFAVGSTIEFKIDDIKVEIEKARQLSLNQMQKWEAYARQAGIK